MVNSSRMTLMDAVGSYVGSLRAKDSDTESQQHLVGFVRWMGGPDRMLHEIRPSELGEYGEQAINSGAQSRERLQNVKKFLSYARKQGLIDQNLAQHVRVRKGKRSAKNVSPDAPKTIELSRERYQALAEELEGRKDNRRSISAQISKAAADKDVRENAPLEMARQEQGFNEAKIREIEDTLDAAVVVEGSVADGTTVGVGASVLLKDVKTGEETRYTLVSAMDAAPLEGKISDVSPVGRALMSKSAGQEVQVKTPRGSAQYRIVKVTV